MPGPVEIVQQDEGKTVMFDPSEFRPESKKAEHFRNFMDPNNPRLGMIRQTYIEMHTQQTLAYVKEQKANWLKFDKKKMTVMEALEELNKLVDESDPDVDVPNSVHAFQTAERIREKHPDKDWMQLVGLIHDLGKVMAVWGQPQFSTVGDIYPVGCRPDECVVFHDTFKGCPDLEDPVMSTKLGIYTEGCGLRNVHMSWSHDEYMYQVLKHNNSTIPEEGLYMVRFHSFYPWHTGGAYDYLCDDLDRSMLKWIREFNQFDLYSKSDSTPDPKALHDYYQSLVDKYCPGVLEF